MQCYPEDNTELLNKDNTFILNFQSKMKCKKCDVK